MIYRAPVWSNDEAICCRNVNNELHFYENNNFGMPVIFLKDKNHRY